MDLSHLTPGQMNLIFSSIILFSGLGIYWFWHPPIFHEHPFVERAFEFWVLKCIAYVVIWGLVTATADLRYVLVFDDLNTIVGFGFVVAMWRGDSYDQRHTSMNLIFLFGLLFAWNFVVYQFRPQTVTWIFPSMTASLILIASMGIVTLARCGPVAIPFAVAIFTYFFLQLPTYEVVYKLGGQGQPISDPELVRWLGFGKLLFAGLFYQLFPSSLKRFDSIEVPTLPIPIVGLRKVANWSVLTIGGGIFTELVFILAKKVWGALTKQHL
jgi:hypothetical protein